MLFFTPFVKSNYDHSMPMTFAQYCIYIYIYTWKANCHQSLDEKVKPNMADMEAFWTSVSGPYAANGLLRFGWPSETDIQGDRVGAWNWRPKRTHVRHFWLHFLIGSWPFQVYIYSSMVGKCVEFRRHICFQYDVSECFSLGSRWALEAIHRGSLTLILTPNQP